MSSSGNMNVSPLLFQVVPLTQRSGIVEWCEGTISLGSYLIGTPQAPNQGAHARYHPKDWPNNTCRKKLLVRFASSLLYSAKAAAILIPT